MAEISLCVIMKDEESMIGGLLESVQGLVDEIIVVDTGSTDKSREIAAKYTDKIFDYTWADDFAAARKFSFAQATKDFILWLDADDILPEKHRTEFLNLKNVLDSGKYEAVSMNYDIAFDDAGNLMITIRRHRIVKKTLAWEWVGKIHEVLTFEVNPEKIFKSDISIVHRKKFRQEPHRNLRIYESFITDWHDLDPRNMYSYARELVSAGQNEKCFEILRWFIDHTPGWMQQKIEALNLMADTHKQMGNENDYYLRLLESLLYGIPRAEFCCKMCSYFLSLQNYSACLFWAQVASQIPRPPDASVCEEIYWTYLPYYFLGVSQVNLGSFQEALEAWEKFMGYFPDNQSYKDYHDWIVKVIESTKKPELPQNSAAG